MVVEAATKTAAAAAASTTTCCRDWNRARRNLKLPTFPSPLTDADGRGDPRGEIVSPVKKKTPAIHPKPDPAEATPRSVGRLRRGFAGRRAARHSTAVRRRPCRCLSALPASADGRTDGRTAENNNALFRSEADHWAARRGPFDTPLRSAQRLPSSRHHLLRHLSAINYGKSHKISS